MSESDVCRRQILTYKDDPRAERVNIVHEQLQQHKGCLTYRAALAAQGLNHVKNYFIHLNTYVIFV